MAGLLPSHLLLPLFLVFSLYNPSFSLTDDVPLVDFKESLYEYSELDPTWVNGTNPCNGTKRWRGVECSGGKVSGLYLMNMRLSGDVDIDSLSNLQGLRVISLENNSFSGPIPGFNRLTSLKSLFLSGNQFSGEIPADYFKEMRSLKRVELARNKFSGRIPDSLAKLETLTDLNLERNQFSGPVPTFSQKSLHEIDMSDNKLQGEIPQAMERFGVKPFDGNEDLCGPIVSRECKATQMQTPADATEQKVIESRPSSGTKWMILVIVVALLLATIMFKAKQREDGYSMSEKEKGADMGPLRLPSSNRRNISSHNRKGYKNERTGSSKRGRSNDLVVVNNELGVFGLPDLMRAAAEVLGSSSLGSAYKAVMANGVAVVVKRLREMNKLSKEAFDGEIRLLGKIRHRNILAPLAYHFRKEEKLLVSEYIPKGSLLFLLHGDRGNAHSELSWPTRLKIIKGVARGMGFLHIEFASHKLPHGNLKSSNILLSPNHEPILTDYALHRLVDNTSFVAQSLFAYKCPEAIMYQHVSPKSDVYCLGIVMLEIITGKFPSQYLNNQKGGTDVVQWVRQAIQENRISELIDPEIVDQSNSIEMEELLHIAAVCTESNYDARIEMSEAIRRIEELGT